MKRFFSGSKNKSKTKFDSRSPSLGISTKGLFSSNNNSNTNDSNDTSLSETSARTPTSTSRTTSTSFGKRLLSSDSSPSGPTFALDQNSSINQNELSPELTPIVTLLSAQSHRRYHKGVILVLHDLKNDGSPADRVWKEYFAVILGTQLALWDANKLANYSNTINKDENLKKLATTPKYINFTDATIRPLDSDDSIIENNNNNATTNDNSKFENVLVISTTLKNRFFLKFSDLISFHEWTAAIRLSLYENVSLQEAYTGAFLSSRGSKLGDIKNILASDNKFDYSEWVSVRFGTGMPWKRCYAVVSQYNGKKSSLSSSKSKKKNDKKNSNNNDDDDDALNDILSSGNKTNRNQFNGTIRFYENDKKVTKKKNTMATVTDATALYAVYPSSPLLIDNSTIIKLDGTISFSSVSKSSSSSKNKNNNEETTQNGSIFIMAEKHSGVPSYDTIIRFLIPAMNAFNLYGRPKHLIANRNDPNSLLFALPTLPCIYYLEVKDILDMININETSPWNNEDWNDNIDQLLKLKIKEHNYVGCGFKAKSPTIYSSPTVEPEELFKASEFASSSSFFNQVSVDDNMLSTQPPRDRSTNNIPALLSPTDMSVKDSNDYLKGQSGEDVEYNTPSEHTLSATASVKRRSVLITQDSQRTIEPVQRLSYDPHNPDTAPLSPKRELNEPNDSYLTKNSFPEKELPQPPILSKNINTNDGITTPPSLKDLLKTSPTKSDGYESPYEEYVGINSTNKPFEISGIPEPIDDFNDVEEGEKFASAHSSRQNLNEFDDHSFEHSPNNSNSDHYYDSPVKRTDIASLGYHDDSPMKRSGHMSYHDDSPVKRTDNITDDDDDNNNVDVDPDFSDFIDKINDIEIDDSKIGLLDDNNSAHSFEQDIQSHIEEKMLPDEEIDPDIASNLHLNINQSLDKHSTSDMSNFDHKSNMNQDNNEGTDIFDPDYVEQHQMNETESLFDSQSGPKPISPTHSPNKKSIPLSTTSMNLHHYTEMNSQEPLPLMNNNLNNNMNPHSPQRFTQQPLSPNANMQPNGYGRSFGIPNSPSRLQGGYPPQQQQQVPRQNFQRPAPQNFINQQQQNPMNRRTPPQGLPQMNQRGFAQYMPNSTTQNPYSN